MTLILLSTVLFTSSQYCLEVAEDFQAAVERGEVTQLQANDVSQWCLENYTKGA